MPSNEAADNDLPPERDAHGGSSRALQKGRRQLRLKRVFRHDCGPLVLGLEQKQQQGFLA